MITIGFSTRKDNQEYIDYIQKINEGDKSLSQVYNEILNESENDIVVFLHDDLEFETKSWGDKLLRVFSKNPEYGIIGLAGTKYLDKSARWWTVAETMYGIVNHKDKGKKWTSKYSDDIGQKVEETIIVDGLFFAVDKNKIVKKFDESINGFHFYDLGFCLPNYQEGVKIGITTQVRVTHLSIGQTNQQWEDNRVQFSEKYSDVLPIDILPKNQAETFIFCHDQDLILEFEKNNKFSNLYNYTYVFLGSRDIDKLEGIKNLIVARNLEHNLEEYPLFTSFTGWYALWKNNLISTPFVNMFEYDVILSPTIDQTHSKFYNMNVEMIGYNPFPMSNYHFIQNPEWVEYIIPAIKQVHKQDVMGYFGRMISQNPQAVWSSTSNTSFRRDVFEQYMKWFEPLIPFLKETKTCGHAHERSITFFAHLQKKKQILTRGLLTHLQLDSHKTQGHDVNVSESFQKLIYNQQ